MLPARRLAVPVEWDHASGRAIGRAALDNCFTGWDGRAEIDWATEGPGLVIEAGAPFRHLIVYTPQDHDYFCVEPVSHLTDAINRLDERTDHGMSILNPGETLRGVVTFRIAT